MIEIIGGLLFILIGLAIVYFKKDPKITTIKTDDNKDGKDKKDTDKDKTALSFISSIPLEDLESP